MQIAARVDTGWVILPYSKAKDLAEASVTNLLYLPGQLRHDLDMHYLLF